jgi:hypothetical protein
VRRKLSFLTAPVLAAVLCTPAYAQDQQQSLGDVARQARKDKEKSAPKPKTVYTEDTLGSGKTGSELGLGVLPTLKNASNSGPGAAPPSGSAASGGNFSPSSMVAGAGGNGDPVAAAYEGIERAEGALNRLEPMDRATLAKTALEGSDVNFPGRSAWEEKLFAAKQVYVSRSRQLLRQMQELMNAAQSLQGGGATPDSSQAQEFLSRAQVLQQLAVQTESAFKAVISEGQDLAKQAKPR